MTAPLVLYPEIMDGLAETAAKAPVKRRYCRAVLQRLDRTAPKKSLYKGNAHYLLLLNAITRGLRSANHSYQR